MRVRKLTLSNFRNYAELEFEPSAGINVLYGANAQGKTNVLEAIAMIATTRSPRAGRESELIRRGQEIAVVTADVERERRGEAQLQVHVNQSDKKSVLVNGLRRPRVVDLLGEFNVVSFGAGDLEIVTGEPSARRHYLNVEISQISPGYVYSLAHYKRVLEQRNRLLRDLRERPRRPAETGLEAWNAQLVLHGAPLIEKRQFFVRRLAPLADEIHRELTVGRESLEVRYIPSVQGEDGTPGDGLEPIAGTFEAQLTRISDEELRRGVTLLGPQRDDLAFSIDGSDARTFASQGQQRTVTLALKLAEFQLFEQYVGEAPVMLLDDVMSDLDPTRRRCLLDWVRRRGQTLMTCTNLKSLPDEILREAATFHVVAGTVASDADGRPDADAAKP